ncbi:MAG: hypothetical protein QXT89_03095 [Candidatus Micrarchaeaceae archaeon]
MDESKNEGQNDTQESCDLDAAMRSFFRQRCGEELDSIAGDATSLIWWLAEMVGISRQYERNKLKKKSYAMQVVVTADGIHIEGLRDLQVV